MSFRIVEEPGTGRRVMAVPVRGSALLVDPFTNKGTAFTREERTELGLHGLLPPAVSTLEQQLARAYENFQAKPTPIEKYVYLAALQDRNEVLFFRLVHEHIEEMMPIVYTPTVGEACQRFSHIYRKARGLYIAWDQRGRIAEVLGNYHSARPSVLVVTDGERILGLGDQGAGGMGIPIGKLCLYTLCAGISPYTTLPIMLDVGTDNEERLKDPLYLGLRQRRVRGEDYQAFVDEFVAAVSTVYPDVLLQWEDFLKENALHQLERFRDRIGSFNDDIQGTAAVTLAGIYASERVTGRRLVEERVVIAGAGASAQGIAGLLLGAMREEGLDAREARTRIYTLDHQGLVVDDRPGLARFKAAFARPAAEVADWTRGEGGRIGLEETVVRARATVLIGTSATPGLFDERVLRAVGAAVERPVVLPLSNPTSKCECTPEQALRSTGGRALVATGSPFAPVVWEGRRIRTGQCNNSFIFPGVGLGVHAGGVRRVSDAMFLAAARALAGEVAASDLAEGSLYPRLERIRGISHAVACAVIRQAVRDGNADAAVLDGLEARVREVMWFPDYLPVRYRP